MQAALTQTHFRDVAARRIELRLEPHTAAAWPALVDYFYNESVALDDATVLPLLALARRLLVASLDAACVDFVRSRLSLATCLDHLRVAVRYSLHDLAAECVALTARGAIARAACCGPHRLACAVAVAT
jgi:hypothetical protein